MSTLKEVARLAGVSIATASLALNGKAVNEDTRKLVLVCAKKLNYIPNRIGQTLSTGKSYTLHIVILNSTKYSNLVVDTTFFYSYIEGALEVAGTYGYSVTFDVQNWENPHLNDYFQQKVQSHTVDGIIIIPQYMRPFTFLDVLEGFPYIILNSHIQSPGIHTFNIDNYLGGTLLAEYMKTCNYSIIGFINGPKEHFDASERRRGFFDIMEKQNTTILEAHGDWTIRSGFEAVEKIFKKNDKVEAIFCGNDFMASGVLRYLLQHDIKVPQSISLIGYDNTVISKAVYPRLTTIDGKLYEIGCGLGLALLEQLGVTDEKQSDRLLIPKLIIRESSTVKR